MREHAKIEIDWLRVFVWFVAPLTLWGVIIGGVGVLAGWW